MKTNAVYFALGRPFSPIYSLAMRLRESLYRRGTLQSYQLPVPVISVGNLTLGGSGKTPMVQYLARQLQERGSHPAIISRGYGGKARDKVNVVSDGTNLLLDAEQAGDEPRLLAETLPGVAVLTGIVRRFPAQRAIDMGADILLLDDGFQHLQIRRDANLVLFNTDRLAGNSRVFPGGDLREPVTALHRATCFVMTGVRADNRERADKFAALLQSRFPAIPVVLSSYGVQGLVHLSQQGQLVAEADTLLEQGTWFGFAGIAHPQSFEQTLQEQGVALAGFAALDDHQHYSADLLAQLSRRAVKAGACGLMTTEKDLVKLAVIAGTGELPLVGLRMQVRVEPDLLATLLAPITPKAILGQYQPDCVKNAQGL